MESYAKLTARVAKLESNQQNMMLYAKVKRVDEANNLLDVEVKGLELKGVPYFTRRAGGDGKTYWVPEVDEVGMLFSPGGDVGNAVFMPSLNYDDRESPENDKNIMLRIFGTDVEEKWDGNDNMYVLSVGSGTERKTEKAGKIEDKTGTAKLTLERAGSAKLEASPTVKVSLTTTSAKIEASPLVKIELGPTGVIITSPIVNVIGILQVGGVPLIVP